MMLVGIRMMKKDISGQIVRRVLEVLHIQVSEAMERLLIQIFKFGIVGCVATVIDFGFLYLFKEICNLPVLVANTLAFCISVIYNYMASLSFVFEVDQSKDKRKSFVIFILCSGVGLVINDLVVWGLIKGLRIYYLVAKVIATLIVMVFNFVTRKKFLE